MKNTFNKILSTAMLVTILMTSAGVDFASAQYYDYPDYTYTTPDYGYDNPNVDYVDYGCYYNCNTSYDSTPDYSYPDYTYTTPDYGYDNPNVDYVDYGCTYNCDTSYTYQDPSYVYTNSPTYTYEPAPTYSNPAPTYTYTPAPTYSNPAPTYTYPAPTYTSPAPTYTNPAPTYVYTCWNGAKVQHMSQCPTQVVTPPVTKIYCSYNGYYYSSQAEYNSLCKAPITLYCALNGQTYSSNQVFADGCKKYCAINGYYYTTSNEYDNYCKAPAVSIYCAINGQTYNSQAAYNQYCVTPIVSIYCAINGQTYSSQAAYNQYCVNNTVQIYCSYNGFYYSSQNEYNNYCKAPVTLYCSLNGQTYSDQNSYANGCKKYCSYNGYYYTTQNEYNSYCKAPIVNTITHRVVTTVPTNITTTSGRCNGVGIIQNGVYSNGYFEFGETTSLGQTTNSANIGNSSSAPFSNTISGLKSNTTYYCRAVMTNANGTYRGEIMSFRTTKTVVNYVPQVPVTPKPIKKVVKGKTVITTPAPKKETICTDKGGNYDTLTIGEKIVKLDLTKVTKDAIAGQDVNFKLTYANTARVDLTNITAKIIIPAEMEYVSSTRGVYDAETRTLNITMDELSSLENGEVNLKLKVLEVGASSKSTTVNGYISYDVLDENGNSMTEENTDYVTFTTGGATDASSENDNNVNSSNSSSNSILPDTLLEWLAVIALIFILIVLGRTIYASINADGHDEHHH